MKINELNQITNNFLYNTGVNKAYTDVVKEASRLVDATKGSVYLNLQGELKRVYTNIVARQRIESRRKGYTWQSLNRQQVIIIDINSKEFKKIHPEFDNKETNYIVLIPLSFDKKGIGVISLFSKRKRIFKAQELKTLKLFGNIASLRIKNAILLDELTNAFRTRDLFISLAVHELNTPITTISGYLSLFRKKLQHEKPNGKLKQLDSMQSQVNRLKDLISDFEQFNQVRYSSKTKKTKKFNIKQALSRAIIDFRTQFPSYKLVVESSLEDSNFYIKGDIYQISQVFTNLLENSAKFSKDIHPIKVNMKKGEDDLNISIIDSGIGVDKKDIKNIFDGHHKARGNTREGIGLGLYLSKIILQSHGGSIKLKSKVGSGTAIEIKLPLN